MDDQVGGFQDDIEERKHFQLIVESFKAYDSHSSQRISKLLSDFRKLPERQRNFLPDYEDNCKTLLECNEKNYQIIQLILEDVDGMFENSDNYNSKTNDPIDISILHNNIDKVYTTLKQVVRDWSEDGALEREACYGLIISELRKLHPNINNGLKVLVPGSGLGRLAFDIANLGFSCEGNEFSLHMLITSNFIINQCMEANQYTLYPYTHLSSNNLTFQNQVKPIKFPDISPFCFENEDFKFSMAAGDFLDIYNKKDEWDNIVTCFFIDTAHNVIDYIEKIWDILKPGGYWLNFGPLLYHYSNQQGEKSLDLSYEQIKKIIQKIGFKYIQEKLNINCHYMNVEYSMLQYNYNCLFSIVQKPY